MMNSHPSKSIVPRDELAYNVKDLLVYCFQHWRSALILMLVGGLLFGLLHGISAYREELYNRELLSHNYDEYLSMADNGEALSDDEYNHLDYLRRVAAIQAIDRKSAQISDYVDHSLLMRIDPEAVATATATIVILPTDADDLTAVGNLLSAYRSALLNGAYLDELAESLSTKGEYLRELISVSINGEIKATDNDNIRDRIRRWNDYQFPFSDDYTRGKLNVPSSVLELRAIAAEPDLAEQLMDAMLSEMTALQSQFRLSVAPHTLSTLNRTIGVVNDSALMDTQLEQRLRLYDLPSLRDAYFSRLLSMNIPTVSGGSAQSAALKDGVKSAVIGAVALFILYGLLLCLRYLFSERPLTEIRFQQHYRLLPLAAFRSAPSAVYRRRGPFDRWLRRTDRMMVEESESGAVYDLAAGNLQLYGGELHTVLISGAASTADKQALADALGERLSGVKFVPVSDLVDIRERMKLADADAVIFFESFDATRFPTLSDELRLTERAAVRPIGCVLQ